MAPIVRGGVWMAWLVVLMLLGCDRAPPAAHDAGASSTVKPEALRRVGSCDRGSLTGTCSEYGGTYLAENEILLTSSCAKLGGTFVYAECPNTSVIGGCTLSTGEIRKFYGTGSSAYTVDRAQNECVSSYRGTWTPR